jgi:hypothetical protein
MNTGDRVRFIRGARQGQEWLVRQLEVGYWTDDSGVVHANYTIGLVPNERAIIMLDAKFEDLEVIK